jgi:hypothetical protein
MALSDAELMTRLEAGRHVRLQTLTDYLAALPIETNDKWEFLRCILLDVAQLHAMVKNRSPARVRAEAEVLPAMDQEPQARRW